MIPDDVEVGWCPNQQEDEFGRRAGDGLARMMKREQQFGRRVKELPKRSEGLFVNTGSAPETVEPQGTPELCPRCFEGKTCAMDGSA
ncbi:MAG: hypothetical protein B6A08_17520 [Sorangiineae bacterium NIC37A_2]|nr:MAG: hypothetical protein B6A08_17520 [Sorangiineae bacterium NIC37A_2]